MVNPGPSKNLSNSQLARRKRVVDCAERLFGHAGVKATTMEAIAREAGLSKPTLYSYFTDKDQVVQAVAKAILERMSASLDAAMSSDQSPQKRIVQAMQSRLEQVYDLIITSPHAQEIYQASGRKTNEQLTHLNKAYLTAISAVIESLPDKAGQGKVLASVIIRATDGLKHGATSREQLAWDVATLVNGVLK